MAKTVLWRLVRLVATLFVVTFFTFSLTYLLPGDAVTAILGPENLNDPELIEKIRSDLDLDKPFFARYGTWLADAARFDFGESYINRGVSVSDTIKQRLPVTSQLAVMAVFIALLVAIPTGIVGAYKQGRWQDKFSSAGMQVALSVPNFITGIFLIWLFAVQLNWLPASGWSRISEGLGDNLKHAILPATALASTQMAIFSRLLRADMISTLQENYVLAARAKGLPDRYILARHAFRPSSLSLVTIVGLNIGALLGGTVIIEFLFGIGGLGTRLISAILQRDVLVIQGITVFIATVYVLINTLVDLLYVFLDPRIRRS